MESTTALISNDVVSFGLLVVVLAGIFHSANSRNRYWRKLYRYVPVLLMCYMVPAALASFGVISTKDSSLWFIAKNYFLPASLVLMTLSIDMQRILALGSKALIMFGTATVGIILGGPISILIVSTVSPETVGGVGPEAVWRGLATLAGSWIGGGANQTAMLELYQFSPENYSAMVAVDIIVANIWMAFLLWGAANSDKVDKWLGADTSAIDKLKASLSLEYANTSRELTLYHLTLIFAVAFGTVGLSHLIADILSNYFSSIDALEGAVVANHFFWVVVISTTVGLLLSFTKARSLESYGASKFGSLFVYLLVIIIGTKMNLMKAVEHFDLIFVGLIWMSFHVALLFLVARIIRAPFFFLAVASKANVGGAASAPIVAAAFHPALAPVGVLLAVLGYAIGTYGAILCARLMQLAAGS